MLLTYSQSHTIHISCTQSYTYTNTHLHTSDNITSHSVLSLMMQALNSKIIWIPGTSVCTDHSVSKQYRHTIHRAVSLRVQNAQQWMGSVGALQGQWTVARTSL